MRRSFDSQFNRLQVVLFCLFVTFALIAVAPQALAHEDGEPVVVEIDVIDGALSLGNEPYFTPEEYETFSDFERELIRSADLHINLAQAASTPKDTEGNVVQAPTFFEWKSRDGSLSFTDREKQVPVLYRTSGAVAERKWSDLDAKVTIPEPGDLRGVKAELKRLRTLNAELPINQNRLAPTCTGPVTVTSKRVDVGDYNTRLFYVTDECGRVRTVTGYYPNIQINR